MLRVGSLNLLFRQENGRLAKQELRYVLDLVTETGQVLNAMQTKRVEASAFILLLLGRKAFRR